MQRSHEFDSGSSTSNLSSGEDALDGASPAEDESSLSDAAIEGDPPESAEPFRAPEHPARQHSDVPASPSPQRETIAIFSTEEAAIEDACETCYLAGGLPMLKSSQTQGTVRAHPATSRN